MKIDPQPAPCGPHLAARLLQIALASLVAVAAHAAEVPVAASAAHAPRDGPATAWVARLLQRAQALGLRASVRVEMPAALTPGAGTHSGPAARSNPSQDLEFDLTGPFPKVKLWLREALDRIPHAVAQRVDIRPLQIDASEPGVEARGVKASIVLRLLPGSVALAKS